MAVAAEGLLENKRKAFLQAEICIFSSSRMNCSERDVSENFTEDYATLSAGNKWEMKTRACPISACQKRSPRCTFISVDRFAGSMRRRRVHSCAVRCQEFCARRRWWRHDPRKPPALSRLFSDKEAWLTALLIRKTFHFAQKYSPEVLKAALPLILIDGLIAFVGRENRQRERIGAHRD